MALRLTWVALLLVCATAATVQKRDAAQDIKVKFANFKDDCFPRPNSEGCRCFSKDSAGKETTLSHDKRTDCVKSTVLQTVENKAKLNEEFKSTFGGLREGCFPRPKQGCRCVVKDSDGTEQTKLFDNPEDCTGPSQEAVDAKKAVLEEFKQKFGNLKENCFPKPGKGCRCVEKDQSGNELTKKYETDAECKIPQPDCTETECKINKRDIQRERTLSGDRPSQNVRDPVREKAQANYQAVINELKDKFRGLKEGCFPRPKGCLCVIGKDVDGRDITDRRMKDADCKCQAGETGPGCPAAGA